MKQYKDFNLLEYITKHFGIEDEVNNDGNGIEYTSKICPFCGKSNCFKVYNPDYGHRRKFTWMSERSCLDYYMMDKPKLLDEVVYKDYYTSIEFFQIYDQSTWDTAKNKVNKLIAEEEQKGKQISYLFTNSRGNLSVNTSLLAEHIRQNNHYYIVKKQGSDSFFIYWYEDGYYKELSPNELKAKIKALIPLEIRKPSFWEDTYKDLVATDNFIGFEEMNDDERHINFQNGVLDTHTWELIEHDPKYRHIYQVQCNYNKGAADPTVWKDFINTLAEGDNEIEATLQEWFGLNLSNYNANMCKKAIALYGPIGDTGKSKYLNVMAILIGINNICSKSIQDFSSRFGGGSLYGKKCVLIDDQKAANIENGSIFKAVTGGGVIEAELKGKQPFSFIFKGGVTFTCNAMPYIKDDKGSHMFERFLIIPCNNVIPKGKRDITLLDKLIEEKEGIAIWAIKGLKRLISNNFKLTVSTRSIIANEDYRKMNDTFFRFVSENYTITGDKKDMIPKKDLEEAYSKFCTDNGLTPLDKKNIPERAEANGIAFSKYQGYWYYRGIEEQLPF